MQRLGYDAAVDGIGYFRLAFYSNRMRANSEGSARVGKATQLNNADG